jgi:hypothetical protein
MCSVPLLLGALLAAQAAYLVALGFVIAAVATGSNPFTSGGSPVLLGTALGFLAAAVISIGFGASRMGACTTGRCGAAGSSLMRAFVALEIALVALSAATAIVIVPSAVPFAGAVIAGILAATIAASAILFSNALNDLRTLETCLATPPSAADTAATVLGVVIFFVAFVAVAVVGAVGFGGVPGG